MNSPHQEEMESGLSPGQDGMMLEMPRRRKNPHGYRTTISKTGSDDAHEHMVCAIAAEPYGRRSIDRSGQSEGKQKAREARRFKGAKWFRHGRIHGLQVVNRSVFSTFLWDGVRAPTARGSEVLTTRTSPDGRRSATSWRGKSISAGRDAVVCMVENGKKARDVLHPKRGAVTKDAKE